MTSLAVAQSQASCSQVAPSCVPVFASGARHCLFFAPCSPFYVVQETAGKQLSHFSTTVILLPAPCPVCSFFGAGKKKKKRKETAFRKTTVPLPEQHQHVLALYGVLSCVLYDSRLQLSSLLYSPSVFFCVSFCVCSLCLSLSVCISLCVALSFSSCSVSQRLSTPSATSSISPSAWPASTSQ